MWSLHITTFIYSPTTTSNSFIMSTTIVFFSIGNPGPQTRHSVGHLVLKELADALETKQLVKHGKYSIARLDNLVFVKSNAYMNESGALLRAFLANERVGKCTIVVVYDDFELDLPKVRVQALKKNESHNGIKAVQKEVYSLPHTVYKLGVGVGPKPQGASKDTMASFVLSDFTPQQKQSIPTAMKAVFQYVHQIIEKDGELGDTNKINSLVAKTLAA